MKTTQTPHLKDNYHQHWSQHTISIWRGPLSYNVPPRCPKWIHILRRKENADTWGANVVSKVRTQSYLHSPPPILTRLHPSSPSYLSQQCLRHFVLLKKKCIQICAHDFTEGSQVFACCSVIWASPSLSFCSIKCQRRLSKSISIEPHYHF